MAGGAVEPLNSAEESATETMLGAAGPGISGKPAFRVVELPTLEQVCVPNVHFAKCLFVSIDICAFVAAC